MASAPTPVWFITACSSGFGKYIALEALARGHKVIASARSTARIADLQEAGADVFELDVTAPLATIKDVAQKANDKYGYITHLVNAAGYLLSGAVEETSPEEDYDTFNTNVFGMLNVSKAFLPYLRGTKGEKVIANFGSIGSWFGSANAALYCGTKWACSGISESMRGELKPFGIEVTVIEPGYFRTGFLNSSAKIESATKLQEYDESETGQRRKMLEEVNNKQTGDVEKGCRVIVDILTHTGVAQGKEIPMRVALGSDAPAMIREKMRITAELLDEWDDVTTKTDHE